MSAATEPTSRSFTIRPSQMTDLTGLLELVEKVGVFTKEETSCACELIASALSDETRSGDYRVLVAQDNASGDVAGYICYGPTPMTQSTWDLYWLATHPQHQRQGIAAALCAAMEDELRGLGGKLVRVETSSTEGYGSAQRFYERNGYPSVCIIPEFYKPDDDLIIMIKKL